VYNIIAYTAERSWLFMNKFKKAIPTAVFANTLKD
jgi:hypothetical protein